MSNVFMNRDMQAKIEKIEDDYGFSFQDLLKQLSTKEDYIGRKFNIKNAAKFFGFSLTTFHKICKLYNIKFWKRHADPTHYEDVCWVKYGISVEAYLKTRSRWMFNKDMATELETSEGTIKALKIKYKIKDTWYHMKEERK